MKKNLFNLLGVLLFTLSWQGISQEVEIGNGTDVQRFPLSNYRAYERSASIYTSEEINESGTIYKISWYAEAGGKGERPVKIYLNESNAPWQNSTGWSAKFYYATLVYDGTMEPVEGWNTFVLDTPFVLSGTSGLEVMVAIDYGEIGNSSAGTLGNEFRYSVASNLHQTWGSMFGPPTSFGTVDSNRPNIKLDFSEHVCLSPSALTVTDELVDTIDISWTAEDSEDSWNISWGTPGYTPGDVNELGTEVVAQTSFQITDLTAHTEYNIYVQAICSESSLSEWVGPLSAGTVCMRPTDLIANKANIDDTTAQVSWTAGDIETAWNISWGPHGYTPGGVDELGTASSTTASYTITGLTAATEYNFYVQAQCGDGDVSAWSQGKYFVTDCTPLDYLFENFDSYDFIYSYDGLPDCWARLAGTGSAGEVIYGVNDNSPASGTQSLHIYAPTNRIGARGILPLFSNVNAGTHWLRFKARVSETNGRLDIGYVVDEDDYADFTLLEHVYITNDSWDGNPEYIIMVPTTIPSNAKLAIRSLVNGINYFIDDLYWEPISGCVPPRDLATNEIGIESASFTWSEILDESYDLRYREAGSNVWTNIFDISTNSYLLTGLEVGTEYEVQVRTSCEAGGNSPYSNTFSFTTENFYCEAYSHSPSSTFYLSNVSLNTLDNNSSYTNDIGYSDFTNLSTELVPGETYTISLSATSDGNYYVSYAVWIDYNKNGVFDESEGVFETTTGTSYVATGSFIVPLDVSPVSTTMRVIMRSGQNIPSSCQVFTNGEVEDYSIRIVGVNDCDNAKPENVVVQDVSHTTATVNWSVTTAPSEGYIVEVYETGANQNTDTPAFSNNVDANDSSFDLTGLSLGTTYDVYVISDCGSGTSVISDVKTFTTASCDAVTNLAVSAITHNSAVFSWAASATASEGYQLNIYLAGETTPYLSGTVSAGVTAVNSPTLSPDTAYEVEVISDCGSVTTTSNKVSFTTDVDTGLDYCDVTIYTVESITRVLFAGIDNASTADGVLEYEDFSAVVGQVETGGTYGFTAEGNTDGNFINFFTVWIDWNQDLIFQSDEMYEIGSILNSNGMDGQQASSNIIVPSSALEGNTRMRVIKNFNSSPTESCGTYSYGQIEDYTINVSYPLSIEDNSLLSDVRLYPNPMHTNTFYIDASSIKASDVAIQVNDMLGREIYKVHHPVSNGKIKVDLHQELQDGVYLVTVSVNGIHRVFKVVKN